MKKILLVMLVSGCSSQIAIPDSIKTNESLVMIVPARGNQIYECRETKTGGYDWAFVAPEAELFDRHGKRIGRHYGGPHWEAADGSKVVGAVKQKAEAPVAGNIAWLLLDTKSVGPQGAFSKVTSIQRVATVGGVAPPHGCPLEGYQVRVPYTADYYFFSAK
jgi:hypothetical protein